MPSLWRLRGFFLSEAEEQEKGAYGAYLKSRIRPAVEALIDGDDVEKLEELESLGWLDGKNLDGFIRQVSSQHIQLENRSVCKSARPGIAASLGQG